LVRIKIIENSSKQEEIEDNKNVQKQPAGLDTLKIPTKISRIKKHRI